LTYRKKNTFYKKKIKKNTKKTNIIKKKKHPPPPPPKKKKILDVTIINFLLIYFCGTYMTQVYLTCPHTEHQQNGCGIILPTITTAKARYF